MDAWYVKCRGAWKVETPDGDYVSYHCPKRSHCLRYAARNDFVGVTIYFDEVPMQCGTCSEYIEWP